jgi:lysophospholipase L1-like esterase
MKKAALTLATFLGLLTLPDYVPQFKDYKVWDWSTVPRVLDFLPRGNPASGVQDEQERLRPGANLDKLSVHPLQATEGALDHFHKALRRAELKQGSVRIVHYGDSPTTADLITADVRELLQTQFGDAGHGFHLIAKPWAWYEHRGVSVTAEGWEAYPANQSKLSDRWYGLGGVAFEGRAGAWSRYRIPARVAPFPLFELSGVKRPDGGSVQIFADGELAATVPTGAVANVEFTERIELPAGTRDIQLQVTQGSVRLFGVNFLRTQPGVIYSSLGINGAYINVLSRMIQPDHWARVLQQEKPDLIVINYGTNESVFEAFVDHQYDRELREAIRRAKAATPEASLLIMSPMDRGQRMSTGEIGTVPALQRVVAVQQRAAAETGCGFYNTFLAMGGPGTMGKWYEAEPRLVGADFIHPMPGGARIIGNLFYKALLDGYNKYKTRRLRESLLPPG